MLVGCVSEPTQTQISDNRPQDSSLVSALFETELEFLDRHTEGDAHGMAIAAKARLALLRRLPSFAPLQKQEASELDQRRSAILVSVRDMVTAANMLAQGDEATLSKIERLFPNSLAANAEGRSTFNENTESLYPIYLSALADEQPMLRGMIGGLREVRLTIGLEFEASLAPLETDTIRLPVDGSDGTTIYVQPVGHEYTETTSSISMAVSRHLEVAARWEEVSCPATSAPRLPCYIPPGEHTDIELSLQNNGARPVELLVFISGNAETVSASMSQEAAIQPNRLDDE